MMYRGHSLSGHERNCAFLNTLASPGAGERFATISAASGIDFPDDGRGLALVDWDHDGDLDMWISNRTAPRLRFLRNEARSSNHSLSLRLVGNGTTSNRDAIGARVEVAVGTPALQTGGRASRPPGNPDTVSQKVSHSAIPRSVRTLRAGDGFLSQSSKWLHFGLGQHDRDVEAVVRWPNGQQELFAGLNPDGRYRLVQGSGKAVDEATARTGLALRASRQQLPPDTDRMRIPLVTLYPMPRGEYRALNGTLKPLQFGEGRNVLLNLWSATCRPCLAELKAFVQHEQEIREAGIEIIALNVDLLIGGQVQLGEIQATLAELAFPFTAGFASRRLISMLQAFHDQIIWLDRPLPLPTSFLVDDDGRLSMIYKGSLSVEQLLTDVKHSDGTLAERRHGAAFLPGRHLEDRILTDADSRHQLLNFFRMAQVLEVQQWPIDTVDHFRQALRIDPDNPETHNNLGNALAHKGKAEEAIKHYQIALRLRPDFAKVHNNLGVMVERLERPTEAIAYYREAVRLDPSYVDAYNNLGSVLSDHGQFEAAVAQFRKAAELDPDHAMARHNLGAVLDHLEKKRKEAEQIKADGRAQ